MILGAVRFLQNKTPSRTPPPFRQLCAGAGAVLLYTGAALVLLALLLRKAGGRPLELPGFPAARASSSPEGGGGRG